MKKKTFPGNIKGQIAAFEAEKSTMSAEHKALIKAHNESPNGLKIRKGENKGYSDTPLFAPVQPNLFN